MEQTSKKKIFLSHAYPDRKIADKIIEKVLLEIFKLDKQNDIFYTSKRETGIRSSVNWRNRIKKNLKDCEIFIALITTNYKKSEMCIGELGAAWVQNKKVYTLILPPIKYENFSVIFSEQQADVLINKEDIKAFVGSLNFDLKQIYKVDIKDDIEIDSCVLKLITSVKRYLKNNPDLFVDKNENTELVLAAAEKKVEKIIESPIKEILVEQSEKDLIIERSKMEWPDDFSMQEYYIKEQTDAINEIRQLISENTENKDKIRIIDKAVKEWPEDYTMQLYRIKEEFNAFDRLN